MKRKKDNKQHDLLTCLKRQSKEYNRLPYFLATEKDFSLVEYTPQFNNYFYTIGLMHGDADISIGTKRYRVTKGSVVTIGPGIPCQWFGEAWPPMQTFFFYDEVFLNSFSSTFFFSLEFFCPDAHNILQFQGGELAEVQQLFQTLQVLRNRPEAMAGIIFALLQLLRKKYWQEYALGKKELSPKERIMAEFRSLVAKNFVAHKEVSFYAACLHITPKYLSEVLLETTGFTAKKWIEIHLMQEAKYLLSYVGLSSKEVAHKLGYADSSHFQKAFKKQEHISPSDFKRGKMQPPATELTLPETPTARIAS